MDNLHYFIILLYVITLTSLFYTVKICKNNKIDILYDI
jgi:hypothetical protein